MSDTKASIVRRIIADHCQQKRLNKVSVFAPSNIALVKYWGKRALELNLPQTSSFSITLPEKGTSTELSVIDGNQDEVVINDQVLPMEHPIRRRAVQFFELFRPMTQVYYRLDSHSNIPIAAGLASSASGFAALVLALNELHQWVLSVTERSILARLGSGSACRSFWPGFVEWQRGQRADGMDSHGIPDDATWPELCLGLSIISYQAKPMSSTAGMQQTVATSSLYKQWPRKVTQDLAAIKQAIAQQDFAQLGQIVESNALAMHATMMAAWPPVLYWQPETISQMQQVWALRQQGLPIYFTQDAGPNLKLLFLKQDAPRIRQYFPDLDIIEPFAS